MRDAAGGETYQVKEVKKGSARPHRSFTDHSAPSRTVATPFFVTAPLAPWAANPIQPLSAKQKSRNERLPEIRRPVSAGLLRL